MTAAPTDPQGRPHHVQVWRPDTDQIEWVPVQEAAAGMIAWGRQEFGQGTPGFAVVVERAVGLLAEHGFSPAGRKLGGGEA